MIYPVEEITTVTVADEAVVSAAFQIPRWARSAGVLIPAIDAANVGISVCDTSGGTYAPVVDEDDGAAAVIIASGVDPGYGEFMKFVRSIPSTYYYKLTLSAAQNGGPYTFTLVFKS